MYVCFRSEHRVSIRPIVDITYKINTSMPVLYNYPFMHYVIVKILKSHYYSVNLQDDKLLPVWTFRLKNFIDWLRG